METRDLLKYKGGNEMNDLNKVLVTGTLVKDVELRYTPSGKEVANLRIAINRKYKKKTSGEIKEETEFMTVIVWDVLAKNCQKYLKKGSRIFVEGRFQTREFVDKAQQKRKVTEIIGTGVEFLDTFKKAQ